MPELTIEDFAKSFGISTDDFSRRCIKLINETNFNYKIIKGKKRDELILHILKKISRDQQKVGSKERKDVWEKGWSENLEEFIKSDCDLEKIIPKFFRPNQPLRLNRNYVTPNNKLFELNFYTVFRTWLFEKYFKDFSNIYEFGCGTGYNLVLLSDLFPDKNLFGLDFVPSCKKLINRLSKRYNLNLSGHIFDMKKPNYNFKLKKNCAVFTLGAIEQLASQFEEFVQYLLKNRPRICVHMEPTIELYDKDNLVDYLAIKFHKKRGYTENFLTYLRELENKDKVDILKTKRLFFGSLYMEGYSYIIWKVK